MEVVRRINDVSELLANFFAFFRNLFQFLRLFGPRPAGRPAAAAKIEKEDGGASGRASVSTSF